MSDAVHEVYAIQYAHNEGRWPDNFIDRDPHDGPQAHDYFVWAIVGDSGVYIVDTGFDEAMSIKRQRGFLRPVGDGLKALGIEPSEVDNVIITHLHYDHSGNHDLFPKATFHLQDVEMAYATGRCMCHSLIRAPFDIEGVTAMVRNVYAGRVAFHDGSDSIAPGISVHRVGGHSKGLQCVQVNTKRGNVVLASDATHLYEHVEQNRVFPTLYNVGDVLEGYATLRTLADSRHHIVPGHDPAVLERYPAAKPGLEGWIARLDVGSGV